MRNITEQTLHSLLTFLQNGVKNRGFTKAILGLSGGIDSAVVALLCHKALRENTKVLLMPSLHSSKESIDDSIFLCKEFGIEYEIAPIRDFDSAFCALYPNHTKLARGNFCARMRMATLYHYAQMEQRLVIGTSNKTEIMLGYGTIFGDLASAINPIGTFYKTEIYMLAEILQIPKQIIKKAPSADFYAGQTDADELGYSYDVIDPFLESYEKAQGDITQLKHYPKDMILALHKRIQKNAFKQKMPEIFMG